MKRGASGLSGVLAIDKPVGITSHDVVDRVRRITGERRVGHAGTLDPAASGLMLVAVGAATRLSPYLMGHDKRYAARIVFGVATDTDDSEGRVTEYFSTSAPGMGLEVLDGLDPQAELAELVGDHEQLPPAYSAIKKNGVTAYKAAREGKKLELETRPITIFEARYLGTDELDVSLPLGAGQDDGALFEARLPYWDCELHVSKGTYIRSIARDLGQHLGCGAHLGALRRLAVGACTLDRACTLDELAAVREQGGSLPWCDPAALLGYPLLQLSEQAAAKVANGASISAGDVPGPGLVSCVHGDRLLAVYELNAGGCKPATVLPGGVCGVA